MESHAPGKCMMSDADEEKSLPKSNGDNSQECLRKKENERKRGRRERGGAAN